MNSQFNLLLLFIFLLTFAISFDLGTIYKIHCQTTGKVYVGRTTRRIEKAIQTVKNSFDVLQRGTDQGHGSVLDIFANNNYNVTILEVVPRLSNDTDFSLKLRKLQRFYIDQYDAAINKVKPSRSQKEYQAVNRDNISRLNKKYREKNREVVSQRMNEYYQENKSRLLQKVTCNICGGKHLKSSLWNHNRTKRHLTAVAKLNSGAESGLQYEQQLVELSNAIKVTCEVCGGVYSKRSGYMHKKTKRHRAALAKLSQSTVPSPS